MPQSVAALPLVAGVDGWRARRRADLLDLLKELNRSVDELDAAVERAAQADRQARLLMTQPGVGPITSLRLC